MKIRVTEEGKQFEAHLKFVILENNNIVGVSYAAGFTAARAIHACLYSREPIELVYGDQRVRIVHSSQSFKRIETIDDIITHHTLLPRSTSDEDYQEHLTNMLKNDNDSYPERIVLAPHGNAVDVAGQFIAETFGLPKTQSWIDQYVNLLIEKCKKLEVITTEFAGEWQNLKAFKILSMKEDFVLNKINEAIDSGILNTRSSSVFGDGTFAEDMTTEDYLRANVEILAKKIDATMKPLTDGSKLDRSIGKLKRIPVPVQAKASIAGLEVLKHNKGVFVVGDMGTGKTQISLNSVYVYNQRRKESGAADGISVLIVAPANVVPKWAKLEIPKIVPAGSYSIETINSTEEALCYIKKVKAGHKVPKGIIEFVLVSTDRMKLGPQGYVLGAKWDSKRMVWISPNSGKPLYKPNASSKEMKAGDLAIAGWSDVVDYPRYPPSPLDIQEAKTNGELLPNGLPKGYIRSWKSTIRNFQDSYDGKNNRSIARPARKEWSETIGGSRWMIAQLFQRKLRSHFHLGIFDEVHQMKASGSGRGLALHKMMKAVRKHIYLTGTLTNGTSSSIKSLLWRGFAGEMLEKGITFETSDEQFAQRYGVVEKVRQIDDDGIIGTHTKQKKDPVIVKEKPGISPQLISDFLLDKCIFVELSDLGIPLVKFEEIPRIIPLENDHYNEYKKFHEHMYNTAQKSSFELGAAAWSKFNPTTINYADQPSLGAYVKFGKIERDGSYTLFDEVIAPKFPVDYITEKERQLLKDIDHELLNKRRCIVFTHFSGDYKTNERIKSLIEERGHSCAIMNERVKTSDRVEWLDKQATKGTEVLIMNQRLVEVGLDLMDYPSIMFFQLNDDINVVRQASRRAWRFGQHKNCKVFYYVADKTTQLIQFQRLMSKRVAAMIVEGRIERSDELAKYADTSANGAVSDLSKTLSSVELTNAWVSAAEKDIDSDLEIVSEDDFQKKVEVAFQYLTAETIETCGYTKSTDDFPEIDFEALEKAYKKMLACDKTEQGNQEKIEKTTIDQESTEKKLQLVENKSFKKNEVKMLEYASSDEPDYEQLQLFSELA